MSKCKDKALKFLKAGALGESGHHQDQGKGNDDLLWRKAAARAAEPQSRRAPRAGWHFPPLERRVRSLVPRFVLRAACCVLRAACCVLRAACCVLRAACCVARRTSLADKMVLRWTLWFAVVDAIKVAGALTLEHLRGTERATCRVECRPASTCRFGRCC